MLSYKTIVGPDVCLVKHGCNFSTGYHIFDRYLMAELGIDECPTIQLSSREDFVSSIVPAEIDSVLTVSTQPAPLDGNVFLYSIPLEATGRAFEQLFQMMDGRAEAESRGDEESAMRGSAVIHDTLLATGGLFSRPQKTKDWVGDWSSDSMIIADNLKLLRRKEIERIICPSQYIFDVYSATFPDLQSKMVIIPHPMDQLLRKYDYPVAPHGPRPQVVVSTLYKSNHALLFGVVNRLLEETDVTVLVPNPSRMVNPEHYLELTETGRFSLIPFSSHRTIFDELKRSVAYLDFTQFDESFGFLPREALAAGTSVICRPKGALRELVGAVHHVETCDQYVSALKSILATKAARA